MHVCGEFVLFWMGRCEKEDPQMAAKWYMKAFQIAPERGRTNYDAATCYENGFGVEKDRKEAFRLYRKAADLGDPLALRELGRCYNLGCGVVRDPASAIEWYEKALKERVRTRWTSRQLADLYYFDLHDYEKAFYWDLQAAEANSSIGQWNVGFAYQHGCGTVRNLDLAIEWYQKCIRQGKKETNHRAKLAVALCYQAKAIDYLNDVGTSAGVAPDLCRQAREVITCDG